MEQANEKQSEGPKKRTTAQNAALHVFLKLLAESLNDAGLDQRTVLKPSVSIPWTPESAKEQLWRPIQKALYGSTSTTQLEKLEQVDHTHEVLMRHLAEKFGVEFIEFPHDPEIISNYAGQPVEN